MGTRWIASLAFGLSATAAAQTTYVVDDQRSSITIEVGRSGLFSMFGHEHTIRAERFTGEVVWNEEAPEESRFSLDVDASSLVVADEDVSAEDRAEIQEDMESQALQASEHPRIVFTSSSVELLSSEGTARRLRVTGMLDLRGARRQLEVPFTLDVSSGALTAVGELELESDEWGVPRISAVGGTIKTSEDLDIRFELVAAPPASED